MSNGLNYCSIHYILRLNKINNSVHILFKPFPNLMKHPKIQHEICCQWPLTFRSADEVLVHDDLAKVIPVLADAGILGRVGQAEEPAAGHARL